MILADNATDVYFSSVEETEKAELTKLLEGLWRQNLERGA
jgi:hypothetical protein